MSARCPSPSELERAYWTAAPALAEHARGCPRCERVWSEIGRLVAATQGLEPAPLAPGRREEQRATLLSRVERPAPGATARTVWRGWLAVPLAAAAALVGWWSWPAARTPAVDASPDVELLAHGDARYLAASPRPDQIVRLVEGTVSVRVPALREGERFRVMAADGELEVRAAAFDVSVEDDRLVAVRTMQGVVEIHAAGHPEAVRVSAGETWSAAPVRVAVPPPPVVIVPAPPVIAPRVRGRAPHPPASPPVGAPPPAAVVAAEAAAAPAPRTAAQQAFDDGWQALRRDDFTAAARAFAVAAAAPDAGTLAEEAGFWHAVALGRSDNAGAAIDAFTAYLATHPRAVHAGEAAAMLGWLLHDRGGPGDQAAAAAHFRAALDDRSARVRDSAALGLQAVGAARR